MAAVVISAVPASRYLPAEFTRAAKALSVALPQGWAFFTKDPTEAEVHAYVERDGIWVPIESAQSTADSMGLSRHNRSVSAQIATVIASVGVEGTDCDSGSDIQQCASSAPRVKQRFDGERPPVCGSLLLRTMVPVPFAYGTRVSTMPSTVMVVNIDCNE
ncbi:SdpA family antimicrobial peptide system protein [Microbacterium sp.]|uniref:SdpA family antimicrobial peptide system protein n=1 Tax=Microbacterium sp. TaxID=51671 RepID=UPI003A8F2BE8